MLQQFFGTLISALYDVKESDNIHKHYTIYDEMQKIEDEEIENTIMGKAFSVSLEIVGKTHKRHSFEKEALQLNIQVVLILLIKLSCPLNQRINPHNPLLPWM